MWICGWFKCQKHFETFCKLPFQWGNVDPSTVHIKHDEKKGRGFAVFGILVYSDDDRKNKNIIE